MLKGMLMNRRTLAAAGLLWIAVATAAAAEDEAITLRYRFQPGQELRFRLTLNADMGMTMAGGPIPAGAGVPNKIPMTMSGVYQWVQKVKSVNPDGSAVVSLGCEKMDLTTGVMGMNVQMRLSPEGKLETLMAGQPMTLPGAPPPQTLPNPLYEATIDPTGKIT